MRIAFWSLAGRLMTATHGAIAAVFISMIYAAKGDLVELDAVGGTVLFIRADVHRDGLVFPPFPYGQSQSGGS